MTPREPDHFEAKAREFANQLFGGWPVTAETIQRIADFGRAAESSALERAAQIADRYKSGVAILIADSIRALIPPAAAPAAVPDCPHCGSSMSRVQEAGATPPEFRECIDCGAMWQDPARRESAPAAEPRLDNLAAESPAPVADYDPITAPIPEGDMNGPHGPAPAAETGKAQGAEARDLFAARLATHLVHARARISELETALREAQGQLCAEHCEWTGSGEHDDQCVKLSKALAARAAQTGGPTT